MRLANLALPGTRWISPLAFFSLLVSCVTAAVAIYAWSSLVHGQRVHLRASIDASARECADAIERRAWNQAVALRDLAYAWSRFGPKPEAEWRHDAAALIAQSPAIRSLRWANGPERRELGGDADRVRPEFDAALDAAEAEVAGGAPHALVSPVRLQNGAYGFVVFIGTGLAPGEAGSARLPVLRATFGFQSFVTHAFDDRATEYAYTLSSGDVPVAQSTRAPAPGLAWWRASEPVAHPFGANWRVELRPTSLVVQRELSILPDVLLVTGV
ncbi:MAG TPA: hypothetical protein VEI82_10495, partial [Myxococcota bacterium]|nr:hypothetical protein [Myxococcota bacterium]